MLWNQAGDRDVPLRARVFLAAVAALLIASAIQSPSAEAQVACVFTPSFETLRQQIPAVVGGCLENERVDTATGDAQQRTGGGILMRRGALNWVAFTNGLTTWLSGPDGVISRPASGRFDWEPLSAPPTVPDEAAAPAGGPTALVASALPTALPADPLVALPGPASATTLGTPRVDIAAALRPAYDLLTQANRLGSEYRAAAERIGVKAEVGDLPSNVLGSFRPHDYLITISSRVEREDDRVVATVLAHEITHARQAHDRPGVFSQDECVQREVEAFTAQVKLWDTFNRGSGRTDLERYFSELLALYNRAGTTGLRLLVEQSDGYQQECQL
jgi:hypothetical protein